MSENSDRPGMVWARWRVRLGSYLPVEDCQIDASARVILDDERRALVRAVPETLVRAFYGGAEPHDDPEAADICAAAAAEWADAVLARYDEEVEGE